MSWPLVKLGALVAIKTGRLDANAADDEGLYPFFTCSRDPLKINTYAFDCDAILIAGNGDLNVKHYSGKFNAYQRTYVVTSLSDEVLDTRYLFYFMDKYVERLRELSIGGVIKYIKLGMLTDAEIPLPPLPEQKRIAAILDKADAIRRKRQQAIQLADDFLRAVFLDMFGDPVTNPKGWNVVELSTLVDPDDKLNYGVVQPGDHEEDGVPLVRSGDLSDVTPDVSQLRRVSSSIDSKHRKSKLKGNEILIACVGTIGRVGWVSEAMIGWNIARAVTRIPIREGVNREYVYRYLQNPVVQGYFERETRAVAQPTLNVGLIAKTPVALPPHDLQLAFLERYRTIQAYKERLLVALGAQDELAGCLSQRAFAGQL